jgi:Phage integrase, N-terminal SAM-like domain
MSVERVERKDGTVVWRVRWRQGGQNRSKVLGRKRDAEAFDAELRRKRRTGELAALDAGKETLAEFGQEWWQLYGQPNLAASTLKVYAILWDAHVLPRLGSLRLREITPSIVTRFRLELEAEGIGRASIHKAMTLLQGVLQRACEWDRLASNPARAVRKPTQKGGPPLRAGPPFLDLPVEMAGQPRRDAGGPGAGRRQVGGSRVGAGLEGTGRSGRDGRA